MRFTADDGSCWTGNFQPGLGQCERVLRHPDERRFVVVAGGQGYIIDPDDSLRCEYFGGSIETALEIKDLKAILFGNGLWFRITWCEWYDLAITTDLLGWDRDVAIQGLTLTGQSWWYDDTWTEFAIDLVEGTVTGGSHSGPGSPEYAT